MTDPFFLFAAATLLGVLFIYPISARMTPNLKKFWVAGGVVLIHIGLYGMAWLSLPKPMTASLLLVEAGLFILWDPFILCPPEHHKLAHGTGCLVLAGGVVISLSYFSSFPLWLWGIPALLVLLPFLVSSLSSHFKKILSLATVIALVYFAIIGWTLYKQWEGPTTPVTFTAPPAPVVPLGPIDPSLPPPPVVDLAPELERLKAENASLKKELENLNDKLKKELKKIESAKRNLD